MNLFVYAVRMENYKIRCLIQSSGWEEVAAGVGNVRSTSADVSINPTYLGETTVGCYPSLLTSRMDINSNYARLKFRMMDEFCPLEVLCPFSQFQLGYEYTHNEYMRLTG